MKKIKTMLIIMLIIVSLVGCVPNTDMIAGTEREDIKRVSIADKSYSPVYLYSFSNAKVLKDEVKEQLSDAEYEKIIKYSSSVGYFVSLEEYGINEKIAIDYTNFFSGTELRNAESIFQSVEIEILSCEVYLVTVKEKKDTFVVEFYTFNDKYDINNFSDFYMFRKYPSISEDKTFFDTIISDNAIETVKENVIISYDK